MLNFENIYLSINSIRIKKKYLSLQSIFYMYVTSKIVVHVEPDWKTALGTLPNGIWKSVPSL